MIPRHCASLILEALTDTPVVLVHGARRVGKSTLVQAIAAREWPAAYVTLDDLRVLSAAAGDPVGFVEALPAPVALDEVQRVPELLLAIKARVDRQGTPGQFLLTGSANVLVLPRLSESLAGRAEIITLWPLSQGEIEGAREGFIDALFSPSPLWPSQGGEDRLQIIERAAGGGYPESLQRTAPRRRAAWFESYLTALIQRDLRDLAEIDRLEQLPRLLGLIAARAGGLLNLSELSRSVGIPRTTVDRYFALLGAAFVVQRVPAWSTSLSKRLVRSPKAFLNDSGLLAYLLGAADATDEPGSPWGPIIENLVAMELRKQIAWSARRPGLFHFRSRSGAEVDFVLEDRRGQVVGIEVKSGATVRSGDFAGLRTLATALGERFVRGVVLHPGPQVIPFGSRLHAVPMSALWRMAG